MRGVKVAHCGVPIYTTIVGHDLNARVVLSIQQAVDPSKTYNVSS